MSTTTQHIVVDSSGNKKIVSAEAIQINDIFDQQTRARMVEHMNEDHVAAMVDYCQYAEIDLLPPNTTPSMLDIGSNGFVIKLGTQKIMFEFETACHSALEARQALVELAKKARAVKKPL